ncbi:lineage-specific thermal regulator protein [Maioricimonas rarisocia]|uniref:Lineage-specific thermal regulator protein n=1 Tax=Maioricimonas rarisocia TaxID=2528026 RepID=A0A517Z8H0_9PLAN|nr:PadR family transcriptional regulator [Maioricimonas rarisocia]QDU38731.1 lineage-specific thermal regulator protein [Maioricimonas rarisocia]
MKSWVTQLRKGVVELVVLAALEQGEAYGYELLQRINGIDGLGMTESTVYPLLARLTREKALTVRAVPSSSGPPRRYYRLTSTGKHRLREMTAHWKDVEVGVNQLLDGAGR